ncbi:MAG: efflux RND transporter permease subunit [Micromonosporaceae bacterium]|nr:efflux RND transporter permease subunit [Micromonosporaceae bacterium]
MSLLAKISLNNRGLTMLIAVLAIVFGGIAVPRLKQQLLPSLDYPAAFIVAPYPGAAPAIVDEQVTLPIVTAIQSVEGLESTTSISRESAAAVQVAFVFGTDLDKAISKVESSISRIKSQLPSDVSPSVYAGGTSDIPAVVLAASSSGDERLLSERLTATVLPELQRIDGIREATITGARDRMITITPNPATMATAGVDAQAIAAALRSNGVETPAGAVADGDRSLTVQVGTVFDDVDDLRELPVTPAVRLGDLAEISESLAAATSITRTNGKTSLGIMVTATPDGTIVEISDQIQAALPDLERELGDGAKLTVIFDQALYITESIRSLTKEGLLGLVFAVIVILVFLFSIRSTLVTAISIPMSILIALIALWAGGYSLNILTLGALTIAVGRVVDDSIVVLENIKRHLDYGEDRIQAVTTAVREVAGAVTASTVTTVAVFAPIALVGGLVGQLFSSFAVTIAVALGASLLVALTIIPVLAYWTLRPAASGADPEETHRRAERREHASLLQRAYLPVLRFAITWRLTTALTGLVIFVATVGLALGLKTNFFDQTGQNTLSVTQTMPVGTSLAVTDTATARVEAVVAETKGVEQYQATVGGSSMMGLTAAGGNVSSVSITLDKEADAAAIERTLRQRLNALTGAGEIRVSAGSGGMEFSASRLEVLVHASDPTALGAASEQVRAAMAGTSGIVDVASDLATSAPRVEIRLKRQAAGALGLTDAGVGQLVAATLRGTTLGQVTLGGVPQAVVLRLGQGPGDPDQLRMLPVTTPAGQVPLETIADLVTVDGPVRISRLDGDRTVTVSGTATGEDVGQTTEDLTAALERLTLPEGASYDLGGVSADQKDAFADLGLALLAAIVIVYLVMAITFRSMLQPLILLVSIPFAATGAIGLLLVTGTALGVPALIGALMLVGIVVTNAIVLMDLINKYRASGLGVIDAVVEGGRHRLRPILMTAVATVCALLPMALGVEGSGGFLSQPLAIMVIGGLISSTILTLVLVPTLYTMVGLRARS